MSLRNLVFLQIYAKLRKNLPEKINTISLLQMYAAVVAACFKLLQYREALSMILTVSKRHAQSDTDSLIIASENC